ncbi:caveolin-1-like [Oscarella lobularis]|uniref:caveolin-1-like n=1 Tax=Oscarella lobularis TaxID=121494 RepID=UPI003314188B
MEPGNYESIDEKRSEVAPISASTTHTVTEMSMPDPQSVSNEVRVEFDDIFREPQGATMSSIPQVFNVSQLVYTYTASIVYKIFAVLFSVLLSFMWGLTFALLAFTTVWMINPMIRAFYVGVNIYASIYRTFITLFCEPFYSAWGLIFSRINANFVFKPYPSTLSGIKDV